jgi:hypothetical protein
MLDLFDLLTLTPPYGDDAAAVAPSTGCGTDMIAAGMDWLTGQLQVAASRPVVYRRGVAEIPLCAAFGRTKLMLGNGLGAVRIEWTDRDFLIPTASLVLAGQPIRPQRGVMAHRRDSNPRLPAGGRRGLGRLVARFRAPGLWTTGAATILSREAT